MNQPDKLYRYTTLSNLALILKHKSIRLSSLNDLDDTLESASKDGGNHGQNIFVSCWTETLKESIPLWKMYTPNMIGVRIGLPKPFLKTEAPQLIEFKKKKIDVSKPYLPFLNKPGDLSQLSLLSSEFIKVDYTDNEEKLKPLVLIVNKPNNTRYEYEDMGRFKRSHWSFQEEWRFRIIILNDILDKELDKIAPIQKNFFLEIDEEAFSKMEIILGPNSDERDFEILSALTKVYNPDAKISFSKLRGEIK